MTPSSFVALQTVSTLALAGAVEQLQVHNWIVGAVLALVGIAGYVAYELIPAKPQS